MTLEKLKQYLKENNVNKTSSIKDDLTQEEIQNFQDRCDSQAFNAVVEIISDMDVNSGTSEKE